MDSNNSNVIAIIVAGIVLVLIALAGGAYILDGRTATLVAYNGFHRGVTVTVGDESTMVAPREAYNLSVPAGPIDIHTAFTEGGEIEVVSADLTGNGRGLVVYNVGNRALLVKAYVVYGNAPIPDEELLADQITVHAGIDYPFRTPPDSKDIAGRSQTDTALEAWDDDGTPTDVLSYFYEHDAIGAARTYARAVMREQAVSEDIVFAAAQQEEAVHNVDAWCEKVISEVPMGVERHRYCQFARTDTDAVLAEYTELLSNQPDVGLYHYLLGRVSDRERAPAMYERAVQLDPSLGRAYKALSHDRTNVEDWAGAVALLDQAWQADRALQWDTLDDRLRLRLASGQSATQVTQAWQDEVGDTTGFTGITYGRALKLRDNPEFLTTLIHTLETEISSATPVERQSEIADACLSAGNLDCLRTVVADGQLYPTFLVLSDGATPTEREWVAEPILAGTSLSILGAVHELREGRDASAHIEAIGQYGPDLAALLQHPPQTLDEALPLMQPIAIRWRPVMWFSLYRLTDNPEFLAKAKVLAMPYDLPITDDT